MHIFLQQSITFEEAGKVLPEEAGKVLAGKNGSPWHAK